MFATQSYTGYQLARLNPLPRYCSATPPVRYAPLVGTGRVLAHLVPCAPCMKQKCPNPPETYMECMHLLTVPEVLDAVRGVLALSRETALP